MHFDSHGATDLATGFLALPLEKRRRMVKELDIDTPWVELPVALDRFVESPRFLGHPYLSSTQMDFVMAATDIFTAEGEWKDFQYIELIAEWGKGSGKDTCAQIIVARLMYMFSCLADPAEVCQLPQSSSIDFLNIATDGQQAMANFFNPLKRLLTGSAWFQSNGLIVHTEHVIMPPIVGRSPRGDMGLLNAWSGNSNEAGMEGLPGLFLVVFDEYDAFPILRKVGGRTTGPESLADGLYNMATTSVQSRFPGKGKVILISWPRSRSGPLRYKMAEGKRFSYVYVSGPCHTWDVNPRVTREDFQREYDRNPVLARARYECDPPAEVEVPFFRVQDVVLNAFHANLVDIDTFEGDDLENIPALPSGLVPIRSEQNPGPEPVVVKDGVWQGGQPKLLKSNTLYTWHVDTGLSHDSAAAAMSHPVGWVMQEMENPEGEMVETKVPIVRLDMLAMWIAPPDREIDLAAIRGFILWMAQQGYPCRMVTFDKFASAYMKQSLGRFNYSGVQILRIPATKREQVRLKLIETKLASVDSSRVAYETLWEVMAHNRLIAFHEPLVVCEMLQLQDLGSKIDHPPGGSKDLSDAIAGSIRNSVELAHEVLGPTVPAYVDAREAMGSAKVSHDYKATSGSLIDGGADNVQFDTDQIMLVGGSSRGKRRSRRSKNRSGLLYGQ